jgi:predicted extracellular nuclease
MTHRVSIHSPGRLTVLAALIAGLSAPAMAAPGSIVISQVYGGGGNNGSTYKTDFVELFNRSAAPVTLGNWSVQYASAGGDTWQVTNVGNIILEPGQYYLVKASTGAGGTTDLPAVDAPGNTAMAATAGKVVLVSSRTTLTGTSPGGANVLDVVGFGSANYFEGGGPTPAPANSTAVLRKDGGCLDSDANSTDFVVGAPTPRNTGSARNVCGGGGGGGGGGGTPGPQPIVTSCPASVNVAQGTAVSAPLSATDSDSTVNSISIGSGAVAGITLSGASAASGAGGTARANLDVAANVAAGTYPVVINFGNNDAESASCNVSVRVTGALKIPQIQGSGATSPYNNTVQTTEGVITMKVSSGFFIQDADGDGDPTTSDAIFVFGGSTAAVVGDKVRVTATVSEFTPSGATRSYTELKDATSIVKVGSGFTITPTNIELPSDDLARFEAMLVHFTTPLTVNGNAYLGDRGELVLSNGRREVPTNHYPARSAEAVAMAAANARNMVLLDDGIFTAPPTIPYLAADGTVRAGDTVTGLTGVLDFGAMGGGGAWFKLQPTETPVFSRSNPRTEAPAVAAGNVKVTSANVLNFFTTFTNGADAFGHTGGQGCTLGGRVAASNCRGADNLQEFTRQRDKIVNELKAIDADVVGLMEIQNNGDTAVSYLVDALNAAIGTPTYAVVPKPAATGTDAIRVAMIYKPAVVSLVGGALSDGDNVNNRPPMAQAFRAANGARFSLVVNHLKSKGSCGGAGAGDTDSGDGQGCWNATRVGQAQRLVNYFLPQVVAAAGDNRVLVVGDLNAHGFEDPINYLTSTGGLVNEIERFVRPRGLAYSYVFDGESGYLDHALASASLDGQVADVTEWHNNADEPDAIDYNLGDTAQDPYVNNSYRASDHDPVVVSLNLAPAFVDVTANVKITLSAMTPNRITGKYTGSVSFTNTSGKAIDGPLQLVLQGLPAGVSLDNKSGDFAGAPYVTLPSASLAPGATVTVGLTFTDPSRINVTFTPKLYTGTF